MAFETKSLDDMGFIKIPKLNKGKPKIDRRIASLKHKMMTKRKRNRVELSKEEQKDYSQNPKLYKMQKTQEKIEQKEEVLKKSKEIEKKSKKGTDFLNKFAFGSAQPKRLRKEKDKISNPDPPIVDELARSTPSELKKQNEKSKKLRKRKQTRFSQSNLFVTHIDDTPSYELSHKGKKSFKNC